MSVFLAEESHVGSHVPPSVLCFNICFFFGVGESEQRIWKQVTKLLTRTGSRQCPCVGNATVTDFSVSMETCHWDVEDASAFVDCWQTQTHKNKTKKMVKVCHSCRFFFSLFFVCFCTCMFLISANNLVGSILLLSFCMPFSFCNLFWQTMLYRSCWTFGRRVF